MPKVTFLPSGKSIEVDAGTSLFNAALEAGLPVASSCDQEFVCGRCNMQVVKSPENLSPQSNVERRLLKKEKNPETDRISCQAKILGDCAVKTTYW